MAGAVKFPAGFMVTVVRPGKPNRQGDAGPSTEHIIGPCGFQSADGQENNERGDQAIYSATLLAPVGSDVLATDRVRIDAGPFAGTYSVVGPPSAAVSPFSGWAAGTRIRLRDVEG